jgi:uncharacterized membrane protein
MLKKNLKVLIITSIIILLPMLAGVIIWNQLPDQVPMHWNFKGEVDDWGSKAFLVYGMPLILLAAQWLCALGTFADPKKANHSRKILHMLFWFMPILSILMFTLTYAVALGKDVRIEVVMPVFIGLVFAIIGNYLPKCKQNYTIGIKIPWTLSSEVNWNKTHRFAGWLWTFSGIAIMLSGIFGVFEIFLIVVFLMVFAPVIYSYILYRKGA